MDFYHTFHFFIKVVGIQMKKHSAIFLAFCKFITFTIRVLVRFRYKIRIKGEEVFQNNSPALILPNHQALIDPVILLSHLYRYTTITPVIAEKYFDIPISKTFFQYLGAIRVSDLESGNRDTQVLKVITRSVIKGLKRGNNIVLYPGGQIAGQGYEKIFNKKSAWHIVRKFPDDAMVVGVRISGLWGSMFSKARTGKSPDFFVQLLKGMFYVLANLLFLVPKRTVTLEFEDLTVSAKNVSAEGQKPFNNYLEEFYNLRGEEKTLYLKHYFYGR